MSPLLIPALAYRLILSTALAELARVLWNLSQRLDPSRVMLPNAQERIYIVIKDFLWTKQLSAK